MSNLAPSAATARVPEGTGRLVAALTVLSRFGMIIHDRISLPELSLLSRDVVLPAVGHSLRPGLTRSRMPKRTTSGRAA